MRLDKLGRYEILQELGRGALGTVFLAHDPERDRRVAVKVLEAVLSLPAEARSSAREALQQNFDAVWRLAHPNIVSLLEVHEVEGVPALVIEYVDGQSLSRHLEPGSLLPTKTAIEIVARVAEALDHAHANGIVHGDVKPQNLLRVGDEGVKITDFGLAAVLRAAGGDAELPGELPSYMSPEQVRARPLDPRSDLFSLAAVLYELLTGQAPFPGDSASSIVYRIVHEEPADPSQLAPALPPALVRAVRQGLAKSPEDRFATGARMAQTLREAGREVTESAPLEAQPAPEPAPEPTPAPKPRRDAGATAPPPPPRRSNRAWLVAAVVLPLAALALYFLAGPSGLGQRGAAEVWWEARVRTEPPGLVVTLDEVPLDPAQPTVRFRPEGPFGTLSAEHGCRSAERQLQPADAGGEIVLVVDPLEMSWLYESGVDGARLGHNGVSLGSAPVEARLDLCTDNTLTLEAPGHHPGSVEIPAGATPLEARKLLYGLALERIPIGTLEFEEHPEIQLVFYADGKRLGASERALELEQGEHQIRFKNEYHFIDERRTVRVVGGETVTESLGIVDLASLVVQAFPPNCKVYLRRPGGRWSYIDETPARRSVMPGDYDVKVELKPTGETRVERVALTSGDNPPLRFSFGKR